MDNQMFTDHSLAAICTYILDPDLMHCSLPKNYMLIIRAQSCSKPISHFVQPDLKFW